MQRDEIRRRIDEIDLEILGLLEERMELGLRVRRFKSGATDAAREGVVINRARSSSLALVEPGFAQQLFTRIMGESKRLQESGLRLVAFQGEHGAFSESAARALVANGAFIPCTEFADVFAGVQAGAYDLGVVPVESSLEGPVTQVNDLLTTTELVAAGELRLGVHHQLMAAPGTDPGSIRVVYSHPQALGQCRGFLRQRGLEARPYYDTAGAAMMIARDRPRGCAAIASGLAAELYGLEILCSDIEDQATNTTRFLLLSREPARCGDKCSVVFVTAHEAGQLFEVLGCFAAAGINLTRIASLPARTDPGSYTFFVDLEGSIEDPIVARALSQVASRTVSYRFLGCYPADHSSASGSQDAPDPQHLGDEHIDVPAPRTKVDNAHPQAEAALQGRG